MSQLSCKLCKRKEVRVYNKKKCCEFFDKKKRRNEGGEGQMFSSLHEDGEATPKKHNRGNKTFLKIKFIKQKFRKNYIINPKKKIIIL